MNRKITMIDKNNGWIDILLEKENKTIVIYSGQAEKALFDSLFEEFVEMVIDAGFEGDRKVSVRPEKD